MIVPKGGRGRGPSGCGRGRRVFGGGGGGGAGGHALGGGGFGSQSTELLTVRSPDDEIARFHGRLSLDRHFSQRVEDVRTHTLVYEALSH